MAAASSSLRGLQFLCKQLQGCSLFGTPTGAALHRAVAAGSLYSGSKVLPEDARWETSNTTNEQLPECCNVEGLASVTCSDTSQQRLRREQSGNTSLIGSGLQQHRCIAANGGGSKAAGTLIVDPCRLMQVESVRTSWGGNRTIGRRGYATKMWTFTRKKLYGGAQFSSVHNFGLDGPRRPCFLICGGHCFNIQHTERDSKDHGLLSCYLSRVSQCVPVVLLAVTFGPP